MLLYSNSEKILNNGTENTEILRHYKGKTPQIWKFEQLPDMINVSEQFRKIKGPKMWQDLRERFYDKKINDKSDKKSFQLLHEAVNEIFFKYT